jgi:hypothetical protein
MLKDVDIERCKVALREIGRISVVPERGVDGEEVGEAGEELGAIEEGVVGLGGE